MKLINININEYFHMIPLSKSPIELPVELAVRWKQRHCWSYPWSYPWSLLCCAWAKLLFGPAIGIRYLD